MTSKTCGIFKDISKNRISRAWKYYLFDKSTSQAKCQLFFKQLSAKGSSTKNLLDHLSRIHSFDINSVKENEKQSSIKKHVKRILEPNAFDSLFARSQVHLKNEGFFWP